MNIDFYGYFDFGDEDAAKAFVLAHQFTHDAEIQAMNSQYGVTLSTFEVGGQSIIEEWIAMMRGELRGVPTEMLNWLQVHNDAHQAILRILPVNPSIPYVDLSQTDFGDAYQMGEWLLVHQAIHDYEQQQLGINV